MSPQQITRISRRLSKVLRHHPESIGLELDRHGYAEVKHLLERFAANNMPLTREELAVVVAENNKQRFAFSPDGQRIRASQGHSIDVDLQLQPVDPSAVLYHGTATKNLASIRKTGLEPRNRQHVHLSADRETAIRVGQRHGKPVVLRVDTAALRAAGHKFYRSANGVWLTAAVPPDFLTES